MSQSKNERHKIVADLKRVAKALGRVPTHDQYIYGAENKNGERIVGNYSERQIRKHLGGFTHAIKAAGLGTRQDSAKGSEWDNAYSKGRPKKFRFLNPKLEGVMVHEFELDIDRNDVFTVVAWPDTHVPNQDQRAVNAAIEFLSDYKPDMVMVMGDFLDCAPLSHWPQDDLKPRRIVPEAQEGRKLLKRIAEASKAEHLVFLTGNHEDWVRQAMVAKMPELFDGLEELDCLPDVGALLELDKTGWLEIPLNQFFKVGHAYFTHGLYTGTTHAKKHADMIKANIYYGHTHDVQSFQSTSLTGPMEAHSLGCLSKLDAKFMKGRPNNWSHAIGVFEFRSDGSYTFICPRIIGGKFSYSGKIYG